MLEIKVRQQNVVNYGNVVGVDHQKNAADHVSMDTPKNRIKHRKMVLHDM